MLGRTEKYASTHHFKIPLPLALLIRVRVCVPVRYRISHTNFYQSASSCSQTLIVKKNWMCNIRSCSFGGINSLSHHILDRHTFALIRIIVIFVYHEEVDRCCAGLITTLAGCCLLEGCDDFLNLIKHCGLDSTTYPVVQSHSQIHVYVSSTFFHIS